MIKSNADFLNVQIQCLKQYQKSNKQIFIRKDSKLKKKKEHEI